jgi:hypothetical protein
MVDRAVISATIAPAVIIATIVAGRLVPNGLALRGVSWLEAVDL